jgi:hypothetical protein
MEENENSYSCLDVVFWMAEVWGNFSTNLTDIETCHLLSQIGIHRFMQISVNVNSNVDRKIP